MSVSVWAYSDLRITPCNVVLTWGTAGTAGFARISGREPGSTRARPGAIGKMPQRAERATARRAPTSRAGRRLTPRLRGGAPTTSCLAFLLLPPLPAPAILERRASILPASRVARRRAVRRASYLPGMSWQRPCWPGLLAVPDLLATAPLFPVIAELMAPSDMIPGKNICACARPCQCFDTGYMQATC